MEVTSKMQLHRLIYFLCQLYMFRAMFSSIIRNTRLYLHYVVVFSQVAAGWCLGCVENAMLHSSIAHSIICTRLFRGKMHSDWFNGIEILQGRWQHGKKVRYCYPSGL